MQDYTEAIRLKPDLADVFGNRGAGTTTKATWRATLAALKHYNGVRIPPDYFDEAMERLRSRYLNVPLIAVLHPASLSAQRAATEQKAAANAAPAVQEEELTAQQWFERGFAAADVDEKLRFYTEAIRLKTDYALAFNNRGVARSDKGDVEGGARLCRSKGACSSARPPKLNPEQEQLVRSLLNKGKSVRHLGSVNTK